MEPGDKVYTVESHRAGLPHQNDGVEMYEADIIEDEVDKQLYAKMTKLVRFIGKNSYSIDKEDGRRSAFSNIGVRFMVKEFGGRVSETASDAKRDMIRKIFKKKRWLTPIKVL